MRKPRDAESFREYEYILKFKKSEKILKDISGNLPKVAFIFPNNYEIASGSLAWSWIQQLLSQQGIGVERFFYEKWFKKFYSLESQIPIDEFPVWLITFQFENDLLNIADILIKKGIPLKANERNEYHPLIIIGGPTTLFNYKIVEEIADLVFIGDIECSITQFSEALKYYIDSRLVDKFLDVNEIYSKKFGKIKFSKCFGTLFPVPHSHYVSSMSSFKNKMLIEIGRGCIWRCAFCVTGYTKKPVKFAKIDDIVEIFEKYKNNEIEYGLISATITDYPYLDELLDYVEKNKVKFSVSSMRIDKVNERLLRVLKETNQYSFTVAPEGISQKIRDVMMKDMSTDDIINGLILGRKVGFDSVKLYYIIGLEEEDEKDYNDFFEFIKEVQKMGYKNITLSINPLVPKPMTPFEKRNMISKKEYENRMLKIKKSLPKNVKADFESYKESFIQYEIAYLSGEDVIYYIAKFFPIS
ncbi:MULTISPECIES: B12-binding domain-containing radical SAM protein [Fervidobacterium]|uniref:Radical SAM domain protein n=1 Tax=Fervidobacterium nodosum (strain ATCC 35602 / DSM 5306 / Rt17-B1) TaxID=381764 RepID=A7HJE5_FERNB|nr:MULTISPECIES: radical SAM protein [Fervidobacterium]ABS60028.1 Radical SAM domain protein [Fervidobacterium nodosum Rt17-B1]KAF2961254.1 radical SAM protein [Fervidobacterium sp. 2310opik-2]